MAFLKILIIVIGIYYFFKLVVRMLFPFLVKKTYHKMQEESKNRYKQNKKKEGEITIEDTRETKETNSKKDIGDYVDYEEIE